MRTTVEEAVRQLVWHEGPREAANNEQREGYIDDRIEEMSKCELLTRVSNAIAAREAQMAPDPKEWLESAEKLKADMESSYARAHLNPLLHRGMATAADLIIAILKEMARDKYE